jgi:4-hydroxyacetophenone monooxygenase
VDSVKLRSEKVGTVDKPTIAEALRDKKALIAAIDEADIVPLLLLDAQLSGRDDLLLEAKPFIRGAWSYLQNIPDALQQKIRRRLVDTLEALTIEPTVPDEKRFTDILSVGIGQALPSDYARMMLAEMERTNELPASPPAHQAPDADSSIQVIIVGAGIGGMCMAARLREAGIRFIIVERNPEIGGVWYENTYPGAGVDIPNHYYSFSFAPQHDWSRHFVLRDEILEYLRGVATRFDIAEDALFDTEVVEARFDDAASLWRVDILSKSNEKKTLTAPIFVTAAGQLNQPKIPNIPGLQDFDGEVIHTARWQESTDLAGKRVAMIGTGASSMQVGPSIAPEVAKLKIFQRSPNWIGTNPNYHLVVAEGMKWALANIPFYANWHRFLLFWASSDGMHGALQFDPDWNMPGISINAANHALRQTLLDYMKAQIGDRPDLLAKVTPDYPPYGKRMLRDNHWYEMLKRDNVELVARSASRVAGRQIIDDDGQVHDVDAIVLATGFKALSVLSPMEVLGRDGIRLHDEWGSDDARAHLGITVPKFPNMFMILGPNTGLGHGGSVIFNIECQVGYIMQAIRGMRDEGIVEIECRAEAYRAYNERLDEALSRMVWAHVSTRNWYTNAAGRVVTNSPWKLIDYWKITEAIDWSEFIITKAGDRDVSTNGLVQT